MRLEDTVITQAGVTRCCLGIVALEYQGQEVELGAKSQCPHCKQTFTLTHRQGEKPAFWSDEQWNTPIWLPDWQIKNEPAI